MSTIREIMSNNTDVASSLASEKTSILQRNILREHKHVLPFMHITQTSSNEIGSKICHAFDFWLDVPKDKFNKILEITESLHNVLLLFDDVVDNAIQRRKLPAANTIFTVANTLTASNLVQFIVLDAAYNLEHPEAIKILVKDLLDLYQGQAMELYWSENYYTPTEEEYEKCLLNKTGTGLWFPVKLMQLFSEKKYDFEPLMTSFAKYFQIQDDYNDLGLLNIQNDKMNSISDDDISAGIYSYPIIHALRHNPDDFQIKRILQLRTRDNNIKKHLISLLDKYGSLEHTRDTINKLEQEVRHDIEKLGGNPLFTQIIDWLISTGVSTK